MLGQGADRNTPIGPRTISNGCLDAWEYHLSACLCGVIAVVKSRCCRSDAVARRMKRLSFAAKVWHLRRARRSAIRRQSKRHPISAVPGPIERSNRVTWSNAFGSGRVLAAGKIPMPENLCLEQNYEATAGVLLKIRASLSNSVRYWWLRDEDPPEKPGFIRGYFDYVPIRKCSPAAALVVASEYDRARSLMRWSIPIVNLHRWSPAVVATLSEIGFFDLLDIEHVPQSSSGPVETVKFMTGETVSGGGALKLVNTLAYMILGDVPDDADKVLLAARMNVFGALIEAIENTRLHAYRDDMSKVVVKRWWMTGAVDRHARHINVVVYDQGLSVPETLPEWDQYGMIEAYLNRLRRRRTGTKLDQGTEDAAKLRLAMKIPRSSTGQSNRGKGFPAFRDVLEGCRKGKLRIISRRGEFSIETGGRPRSRALKAPLTGTLVEWDLWF